MWLWMYSCSANERTMFEPQKNHQHWICFSWSSKCLCWFLWVQLKLMRKRLISCSKITWTENLICSQYSKYHWVENLNFSLLQYVGNLPYFAVCFTGLIWSKTTWEVIWIEQLPGIYSRLKTGDIVVVRLIFHQMIYIIGSDGIIVSQWYYCLDINWQFHNNKERSQEVSSVHRTLWPSFKLQHITLAWLKQCPCQSLPYCFLSFFPIYITSIICSSFFHPYPVELSMDLKYVS